MPDSRPKVMHVVANLNLGGSEEVAISISEQLRHAYDFSFFAALGVADNDFGRAMHRRLERLGMPTYCGTKLDMKAGGMLHAGARLRSVVRQVRPDILHLHTDIPDATYAASTLLPAVSPGPQVVRTIHNTVIWPKWRRIGRWVERRLKQVDVVAVSQASLESFQDLRVQQGLQPLPPAQCQVVYNGVTPQHLTGPPAPRAGGPARLLFAARFEPQKGVDLLPAMLQRASQLTDRAAEVTLLGHGSLAPPLETWAHSGELRWPVTLAPPVSNLSAQLDGYDVLLMPSRFEGLGLIAVEALLAGTPVVATDVAGLREVFPAGYPLLAKPEDIEGYAQLLARVIERPEHYRQYVQTIVGETAAKFDPAQMAEGYQRVYRALLARAPQSRAAERAHGG